MKGLITEEEFDRLPEQTQMNYLFCNQCGMFYLREWSSHNQFSCPCRYWCPKLAKWGVSI